MVTGEIEGRENAPTLFGCRKERSLFLELPRQTCGLEPSESSLRSRALVNISVRILTLFCHSGSSIIGLAE